MSVTKDYLDVCEWLRARYPEVNGQDFYREIFPDNENTGEIYDDYSHPNAIFLYKQDPQQKKLTRRIMLNDVWDQQYIDCIEQNTMTLCSGLSYRGRRNTLDAAQRMHALIFDLDGVGLDEIENLFYRMDPRQNTARTLPWASFIVASGGGLHVYYVFKEPVDLFPNIKLQMKTLKYDLTYRMWDPKVTSRVKAIQYQSINQGFRMVGSINEKYGNEVVAFRTGGRVTVDDLNKHVYKKERAVDLTKPFKPAKMSREQAKERYPEWYERVVVNGSRDARWDIAGKVHGDDPWALYHWWLGQADSIKGGHRYFFMMCLAIYACKCDVPKATLRKDMRAAFETLRNVQHSNPLTKADIDSAMEAYDKAYYHYTINDIEAVSGIRIYRNKRNGRKQADHIRLMNFVRDEINGNRNWREGNGRPSAQQTVLEWREQHPEGRKIDCERDTGLSRHTVLKWWAKVPAGV